MRSTFIKLFVALDLLLVGAGAALADDTGGCVVSPENPTLVLTLLGAAAVGLPKLRARIRKSRMARTTA